MDEKALIVVEELNPAVIFTNHDELDAILKRIESQVMAHVPILDTSSGRRDIASIAAKVARSKTLLDALGKDLVADWKSKSKKVDETRKHARDYLDDLKEKVRQPLTDWEEAEKERVAAEELARQKAFDWDEAIAHNALVDREREVVRKEAEFAAAEAARLAKEREEREAREREETKKRMIDEAVAFERARAARDAQKAQQRAEQAERDRIAAIERAKVEAELAEKRRIEAARKAEADKLAAIAEAEEKARREAAQREKERLAAEARERAEAEKKARNKAHRVKINTAALTCFDINGIENGQDIIDLIATGKIDHITINY